MNKTFEIDWGHVVLGCVIVFLVIALNAKLIQSTLDSLIINELLLSECTYQHESF